MEDESETDAEETEQFLKNRQRPKEGECYLIVCTLNISLFLRNNWNNITPLAERQWKICRPRDIMWPTAAYFQWHKAMGVILTLLYRQADIDILKS